MSRTLHRWAKIAHDSDKVMKVVVKPDIFEEVLLRRFLCMVLRTQACMEQTLS